MTHGRTRSVAAMLVAAGGLTMSFGNAGGQNSFTFMQPVPNGRAVPVQCENLSRNPQTGSAVLTARFVKPFDQPMTPQETARMQANGDTARYNQAMNDTSGRPQGGYALMFHLAKYHPVNYAACAPAAGAMTIMGNIADARSKNSPQTDAEIRASTIIDLNRDFGADWQQREAKACPVNQAYQACVSLGHPSR